MKNSFFRSGFVMCALLAAVLFPAVEAWAKDVPVTSRAVQGRWRLLNVVTEDAQVRAALLQSGLEMTFKGDKSVVVENADPETMTGVASRKGKYRVEDGKILIMIEGEQADDPAKAVIRDGKHLVLLPSAKFRGEMVFAQVKE